MNNKEFMEKFQQKINEGKQNYEKTISEKAKKERAELKEKIISEVQEKFLDLIPNIIVPGKSYMIKSNIIKISDVDRSHQWCSIGDVHFADEIEALEFINDIRKDLSQMLNREVKDTVYSDPNSISVSLFCHI